jgi:hypothetical protein
VALPPTKISANDPPSTWWPGEVYNYGQRLEGHPRSAGDDMAFKTKLNEMDFEPEGADLHYLGAANRRLGRYMDTTL